MSDYTPTTENVRYGYVANSSEMRSDKKLYEEFDRWLAEVKAQAVWEFIDQTRKGNPTYWTAHERDVKAQVWEEGWAKGAGSPDDLSAPNPYVNGKEQ